MSALLAGCMVGERPRFDDTIDTTEGALTGDAAIDAVLGRLDAVSTATFTAGYTAVLTYDGTTTSVSVAQASNESRRSVSIGGIDYFTSTTGSTTCTGGSTPPSAVPAASTPTPAASTPTPAAPTATSCVDGIDPARVSDTGVTPDFVFGALAKRLRRDAVAKIGATTATLMQVAGQTSTCVDVPVSGGTKVYCALDSGVVTRFVGGDVTIDLVSYSPTADLPAPGGT